MTPQLLNNRYQVIQTLGDGGFGTTYLAEDIQMPSRRKCVIKQLKPIANNPEVYQLVKERFQREAAILEELGDGNAQIPRLYAYFAEAGEFYLIQEWIEGVTLRNRVETNGAQSEAIVREILVSLLPVLSHIHHKGIIHRDIKPDNIILRQRDGKPVLIDFGAVRETMGTVVGSQGRATNSIVIGTPGFMPSEQAAGRPLYSSDLYSLALTMIYLLTARFPQELGSDPQTGEIQWRDQAQVSPAFANILDRAIQYHPRDRYPNPEEMLAAVQSGPNSLPSIPLVNLTPTVVHPSAVPPTQRSSPDVAGEIPPTILTPPGGYQSFGQAPSGEAIAPANQTIPDEIPGWNWGAFLLPGFWSLGNQVWIGLLSWSGLATGMLGWFVMGGVLGAKGNEWAWKSRRWQSVQAFKKSQRAWAIGGAATWGSLTALIVVAAIYSSRLSNSNGAPSTNLFGATETLSEPTTNLDGIWKLRYTIGNAQYDGRLVMQGKTGSFTTRVSADGKSRTIRQTMRLWSSSKGLVVLGYNPVDAETQAAITDYASDNFLFERQPDGSMKVRNCDDRKVCTNAIAQQQ